MFIQQIFLFNETGPNLQMKSYTPNLNMFRFSPFLLFILTACTNKYAGYVPQYHFRSESPLPDYSQLDYWAAHPWKKDPSDSIPAPLIGEKTDSLADAFFIYPTTYTDARQGWNADINDPYISAKTDYSSILYQASVFNQHCRVFSPRYRQAHLSAFFADNDTTRAAFDTAYADVRNAFLYYLAHDHRDRPIIIAGHSQGAKLAERLLAEFFDGKPLQQKLVAAYILGWPIPQNSFEKIPVCRDSLQVNCFCGWRTLRKGYVPYYMKEEKTGSYVTNPLSWTTDSTYQDARKHKGSFLRDFNKFIPHTNDAQIHNGVLWVSRPKFPGSAFFRAKNYHIADVNLFYMNLRKNIEQRILSYLSKN
jgi:pimeloyl-ACP methyl ester carboxylesterase